MGDVRKVIYSKTRHLAFSEKQQVETNICKDEAQQNLDEAEYASRSAQASVRGIKI
jgi:hypothetical protein